MFFRNYDVILSTAKQKRFTKLLPPGIELKTSGFKLEPPIN
jgi:hypothetical protein